MNSLSKNDTERMKEQNIYQEKANLSEEEATKRLEEEYGGSKDSGIRQMRADGKSDREIWQLLVSFG